MPSVDNMYGQGDVLIPQARPPQPHRTAWCEHRVSATARSFQRTLG